MEDMVLKQNIKELREKFIFEFSGLFHAGKNGIQSRPLLLEPMNLMKLYVCLGIKKL